MSRWPSLTEWDREMSRLQREMNRLFQQFLGAGEQRGFELFPAVSVWEDDESVWVEAELPGMELEDLEILVNSSNQLTLSGERKPPAGEQAAWHRQERRFGRFSRTIELPYPIDPDKVEARLKHGVLTIRLPKQTAAKARRITVKAD